MSNPKSSPPNITGFTYHSGIGGGGFADVFLYTQHSTGRGVAVKVLRSEHLSDVNLRQFETEARVMAGVSTHPFIVTIHDAGIAQDGRPYLVMEHYPQPHFGRRASGGRLSLAEVMRVLVQVSAAVETAHRAGILHRDIKPANILTSTYGDPGLTDFGIAGVQTDQGMSTAAGVSYGFSAHEVVLKEERTVSVASGVYSLRATLFALLTGRSPIFIPGGDNSNAAMARRIAGNEVQALKRDDVPRSLEHLLNSALAPDPRNRPASAADLARAIRDIEQEMRLPPTPLVVTGLSSTSSPPEPQRKTATGPPGARSPHGDDSTRRAPRVVHPHEAQPQVQPPPSIRAHPGPPPTLSPPPSPTEAHDPRPSRPTAGLGPQTFDDPTVARARSATTGLVSSPLATGDPRALTTHPPLEVETDGSESQGHRFPKYLEMAAAALAVTVTVGLMVFGGGSGNGPKTPPETTVFVPPPNSPGTSISAPEFKGFSEAGGNLTITCARPGDVEPDDDITYDVFRTDIDDGYLAEGITAETLTIPLRDLTGLNDENREI